MHDYPLFFLLKNCNMNKLILLFFLILSSQFAIAQCSADASVTTWGMHPLPTVNTGGIVSVPELDATPGYYYEYTFSLVIPGSFNIGIGNLGVTKATVTGVTGLPSGLTFGECNDTGCEIEGGTTGCFKILGTPDNTNTPGEYAFTVNITVEGEIPVIGTQTLNMSFPPESAASNFFDFPLDPYVIRLWASSNENLLANELEMGENKPNPFSNMTSIDIEAVKGGDYTFSVTNLLGEKIMDKEYNLSTGTNTIEFDGSNLSNGIYIYSLSSDVGIISKKMIISK